MHTNLPLFSKAGWVCLLYFPSSLQSGEGTWVALVSADEILRELECEGTLAMGGYTASLASGRGL